MGSTTKLIIGEVTGSQSAGLVIQKDGGNVGVSTSTPIAKLDVAGKIAITSESSTPSQPSDGQGYLYTKTDGKLYWRSYDLSETDLTNSGGSVAADDISAGDSAVSISTTSGDITLDTVGDIVLSADGGNVTMDDGTTTVFDFDTDNVIFKMMDDADTGDYLTITMGSNGATVAATNDDDGTAADLTFDVDGTIYLDSYDYGYVILREGANEYLRFERRGAVGQNDAIIKNMEDGMDIVFQQYDGTETLRLNDEAEVVVNSDIIVSGSIILDDGGSIKEKSGTAALTIDASGNITKIGQDSPSSDEVLTWDGSKAVWSAASGGGGSNTFIMSQAIEQTNSLSTSYYYYKNVVGGYGFTNNFSPTNFATSFPYWRVGRYASSGVIPVAADLTSYHLVGHKDGSDNDTMTLKVWKVPAPTNGDAETDIPTLVEMISVEIDVDGYEMFNKSGTLTSSNSFAAGDQWMITLAPTSAYMSSDHYAHLSLVFEPS